MPEAVACLMINSSTAHGCCPVAGKAKFLSTSERRMACWFLCSGLIHLIIEGE
jgi:hypothetical protein